MVYNKGVDKRTVITLGVIVVVIGGAFAFLTLNPIARHAMQKSTDESINQASKETGVDKKRPAQERATSTDSLPGAYVDYSGGALANAKGPKLIFFYAPWCPQCRALEASIKQNAVPDGVTIFKADYDTSQQLRQKYGVTIQTTVVRVDDQGNLVKKYVAYREPSLNAVIKNLLQ